MIMCAGSSPAPLAISYTIKSDQIAAPYLDVMLAIDTGDGRIVGLAKIVLQQSDSRRTISTQLYGSFKQISSLAGFTHYDLKVTGLPFIPSPPEQGHCAFPLPNCRLSLLVDENWEIGTASCHYINPSGEWSTIENASVRSCGCIGVAA